MIYVMSSTGSGCYSTSTLTKYVYNNNFLEGGGRDGVGEGGGQRFLAKGVGFSKRFLWEEKDENQ